MKIRVKCKREGKSGLQMPFWSSLGRFLASWEGTLGLRRPEALLGRFGAALGDQKVKKGVCTKLTFGS